jgi:ubiquitin carboxyl-terminal hydrolase 5/13
MITIESGENSIDESTFEKYVVAPRMFKQLVGKGHAEFSSGRQQDASEYFSFLLDTMSKSEKTSLQRIDINSSAFTPSIFDFNVEYKFVCPITGQVKYKTEKNSLLNLYIPLDKAVNKDEVEQEAKKARVEEGSSNNDVKPIIPLELCFQSMFGDEKVQMYNPAIQTNVMAQKSTFFKTYPRYLAIILKRYYVNDKWVQVKIDAHIPMPEHLDLSSYKSPGPSDDEKPWVEECGVATVPSVPGSGLSPLVPDETLVLQLMSMGFSENGCKRAAIATSNADVETSMNWIFEHMEDPDFNEPISASVAPTAVSNDASSEMIEIISSMGYTAEQAKAALKATDNNLERAADWIFSHMDDLDQAVREVNNAATNEVVSTSASSSLPVGLDGNGKYSLLGFISHIGKNTDSGHYVSHIKKDGEWRLFNDEKVAVSTKPPLELGFIYFYRLDEATESI